MKVDLLVKALTSLSSSKLDDFVDRRHYLTTTTLLIFCSLLIGTQQTFKHPVECLQPANFPGTWVQYTTDYCYSTGTFHTNSGVEFKHEKERIYLNYYLWIPYALAFQAACFYLPHMMYLLLARCSALKYKNVLECCVKACQMDERKKGLQALREVSQEVFFTRTFTCGSSVTLGSYLAFSYLFSKVIGILNIIAQIYFMDVFLGAKTSDWAFKTVREAFKNAVWNSSEVFPRISYCNVKFNNLGQPAEHYIQCLLVVNVLAEKVYVVVYFWLLTLLAMSVANIVHTAIVLQARLQRRAIRTYVDRFAQRDKIRPDRIDDFIDNFMAKNGLLLMRFIGEHCGTLTVAFVVSELYTLYVDDLDYYYKHGCRLPVPGPDVIKDDKPDDDKKKNEGNELRRELEVVTA